MIKAFFVLAAGIIVVIGVIFYILSHFAFRPIGKAASKEMNRIQEEMKKEDNKRVK